MPLHLLGKKSWNVYNPANIARVKADEATAAAREAADEQRMQELDAERRAAILRGQTPPPLPEEDADKEKRRRRDTPRDGRGPDRKRRKLAGEDDTDMDIRLAKSVTAPREGDDDGGKILKLRNTTSDAPLTDHAGNIDLFPVDLKGAIKREKNAEAEKEKKRKERELEDQYTMRFSNAAGFKNNLSQPWYATVQKTAIPVGDGKDIVAFEGLEDKNVWGNEDPRRKEREVARITSNDPFAVMQRAQVQLKKSKEDKKKWAGERNRELKEMRAAQQEEEVKSKHRKRRKRDDDDDRHHNSHGSKHENDDNHASKHGHHRTDRSHSRHRHRSRSRERHRDRSRERFGDRSREKRRDRSRESDSREDEGNVHRSRHSRHNQR